MWFLRKTVNWISMEIGSDIANIVPWTCVNSESLRLGIIQGWMRVMIKFDQLGLWVSIHLQSSLWSHFTQGSITCYESSALHIQNNSRVRPKFRLSSTIHTLDALGGNPTYNIFLKQSIDTIPVIISDGTLTELHSWGCSSICTCYNGDYISFLYWRVARYHSLDDYGPLFRHTVHRANHIIT